MVEIGIRRGRVSGTGTTGFLVTRQQRHHSIVHLEDKIVDSAFQQTFSATRRKRNVKATTVLMALLCHASRHADIVALTGSMTQQTGQSVFHGDR